MKKNSIDIIYLEDLSIGDKIQVNKSLSFSLEQTGCIKYSNPTARIISISHSDVFVSDDHGQCYWISVKQLSRIKIDRAAVGTMVYINGKTHKNRLSCGGLSNTYFPLYKDLLNKKE